MAGFTRRSLRLKNQNDGTPSREEDHISFIPEDMKEKITNLLTIKDAMSLSAVSKQWRHSWKWSLNLDFDAALMNKRNNDARVKWPSRSVSAENYIRWVDQVINSHEWKGIVSFRINHPLHSSSHRVNIARWLEFALATKIRKIVIDMGSDGHYFRNFTMHYMIPEEVFIREIAGAEEVEHLSLTCCDIQNSSIIFSSLSSLTRLSLDRINVTDQAVRDILNFCTNLRELSLRKCEAFELLQFNYPRHLQLQHFHVSCAIHRSWTMEITGVPNLESFECFTYTLKEPFLRNHSKIRRLSLLSNVAFRWFGTEAHYKNLHYYSRNLFENKDACVSYILEGGLSLDVPDLETFLMCAHTPKDYPFPEVLPAFSKLGHLTLFEGEECPEGFVKFLNCLLTMSPLLHTLEIRLSDSYIKRGEALRVDMAVYKKRKNPCDNLKVIKIYNFKRRRQSINLVSYLLKNAVNLKVLNIDRRNHWYEEGGKWIIENVKPNIDTEEIEELFYEAIDRGIDLQIL